MKEPGAENQNPKVIPQKHSEKEKDCKLLAKANKATWVNTDTEGNTNTANGQPEMEQNQANYGRSQMKLHHKDLGQI